VGTLAILVAAVEKKRPNVDFCEELEIVRDVIDKAFSMSITQFVDTYRPQLLEAGATEALLKAIRDQAVAQYGDENVITVTGRKPSSYSGAFVPNYLRRPGFCR